MNFDLSEEQQLLKDTVERFCADHYSFDARKLYLAEAVGFSRKVWKGYADLGFLALPFSEADGGLGGGALESSLILEAMGRVLALEPYQQTVLIAGALLSVAGSPEQKAGLISAITRGEEIVIFVHDEPGNGAGLFDIVTQARKTRSGWALFGSKPVVAHAESANHFIVSARTTSHAEDEKGLSLFMVNSKSDGVSLTPYKGYDGIAGAHITFDGVIVAKDRSLGPINDAAPLVQRAQEIALAALSAEAVGIMDAVLGATIEHLRTRKQFGQVLGKFQALKHRAAEMAIAVEQARSIMLYATLMRDDPDLVARRKALSGAKALIGRSARFVGQNAIQLHGGIGVTEDYFVGHAFRRLTAIEALFGNSDHHIETVARLGGFVPASD